MVVASCFGALVGLSCRRLLSGFAELSYEARVVFVLSVGWGLSHSGCVVGVRVVLWVRGGSVVRSVCVRTFGFFGNLLHLCICVALSSFPLWGLAVDLVL